MKLPKFIPSKEIPAEHIFLDENNPNIMSKQEMEALDKTVTKYGFAQEPWVQWKSSKHYNIIDGQHRVQLLKEKGVKKIVCKVFRVSDDDVRMLRQIANKLRGHHDKIKDAEEFKRIFEAGNLGDFAALLAKSEDDFKRALTRHTDLTFEEEVIAPKKKEPKAKLGQMYALGRHRILCGDCSDEAAIKKLIGRNKIDMIWTDPPYGVKYEQGKYRPDDGPKEGKFPAIKNDDKQGLILEAWICDVFSKWLKLMPQAPLYVCSPSMAESTMMLHGLQRAGCHMQSQLIWCKNQLVIGRNNYQWMHEVIWYGHTGNPHYWCGARDETTLWHVKKDAHSKYGHPTQKPVELSAKAIRNSCPDGGTVWDGFLGSGSSLLAAEQQGKTLIGCEVEPEYCDLIIANYEKLTSKKAKLISK